MVEEYVHNLYNWWCLEGTVMMICYHNTGDITYDMVNLTLHLTARLDSTLFHSGTYVLSDGKPCWTPLIIVLMLF